MTVLGAARADPVIRVPPVEDGGGDALRLTRVLEVAGLRERAHQPLDQRLGGAIQIHLAILRLQAKPHAAVAERQLVAAAIGDPAPCPRIGQQAQNGAVHACIGDRLRLGALHQVTGETRLHAHAESEARGDDGEQNAGPQDDDEREPALGSCTRRRPHRVNPGARIEPSLPVG